MLAHCAVMQRETCTCTCKRSAGVTESLDDAAARPLLHEMPQMTHTRLLRLVKVLDGIKWCHPSLLKGVQWAGVGRLGGTVGPHTASSSPAGVGGQ